MSQSAWLPKNITLAAPTTTVVKDSPAYLHTVTINKPLANGVIALYDHASTATNVFATITHPATLLSGPVTLTYDVALNNGLVVVTSGAAQDVTLAYR